MAKIACAVGEVKKLTPEEVRSTLDRDTKNEFL